MLLKCRLHFISIAEGSRKFHIRKTEEKFQRHLRSEAGEVWGNAVVCYTIDFMFANVVLLVISIVTADDGFHKLVLIQLSWRTGCAILSGLAFDQSATVAGCLVHAYCDT